MSSAALACGDDAGASSLDGADASDGSGTADGSTSTSGSVSASVSASASMSASDSTGTSTSGADTADSTDGASETTGRPDTVEVGEVCPLLERIGEVTVWISGDQASLSGIVYDRPDPWIGPAELETSTCEFHRFATGSCGTCDADEVCSFDGACVPQRLAFTDAELDVTANGVTETIVADGITGQLYGAVGEGDADLALTLRFGGEEIEVPALPFATDIADLVVTGDGDSCAPLGLDGTWTPRDDGSRVRTVIPINHHAGGPTFTYCDVAASAGSFHADADMLVPLAVATCLEFQGVDITQTAAAHTAAGCVEFRLGVLPGSGVIWE